MSLREAGSIRVPQPPPPTNELSQSTDYGFATDIPSRPASTSRTTWSKLARVECRRALDAARSAEAL